MSRWLLRSCGEDHGEELLIRVDPQHGSRRAPVTERVRSVQIAEVGTVRGPVQPPAQSPRSAAPFVVGHVAHRLQLSASRGRNGSGAEQPPTGASRSSAKHELCERGQITSGRQQSAPRGTELPPIAAVSDAEVVYKVLSSLC